MKSKFSKAWMAALLAAGLTNLSQAQPSPTTVPWWDCVISGPRHGLALINFSTNTFYIQEVIVPLQPVPSSGGRNPGGNSSGRNNTGNSTTTTRTPATQIFGGEILNGRWGFDINGRIIGEFIETSIPVCVTNTVPFFTNQIPVNGSYCLTTTNIIDGLTALVTTCYTNQIVCGTNCVTNAIPVATNDIFPVDTITYCIDSTNSLDGTNLLMTTICYSNAIDCVALTNQFSFVGHVVPGRSLDLVCSTPFGKVTYRGMPAVQLPDISGSWYGTKSQHGVSYLEFFTMTPSSGIPNTYDVSNGVGPGYHYNGFAMLSGYKQFGFVVSINPEDPAGSLAVRGVSGPFNSRKFESITHGWEQPTATFTNWIGFDAVRQSP
jgi:hypothetical protein